MMKPKKILYICHDPSLDGAQLSLYLLLKHLDREKYHATVAFHRPGPLSEMIAALGWPVVFFNRVRLLKRNAPHLLDPLKWRWLTIARGNILANWLAEKNIDLVHTNSMMSFEGAYAAQKQRIPHIWHIREVLPGNQKLYGVLGTNSTLEIIPDYACKVIGVSHAVLKQFPAYKTTPQQFQTIYNGVDIHLFSPRRNPVSLHPHIPSSGETPVIAYVARICPQKGFTDLLEACHILKQRHVLFQLKVMGKTLEADYEQLIHRMIQDYGLENHIQFMGQIPQADLSAMLSQAAIFVSPSHDEPFARSVLEAMAMGLAVVGTDSGGTPEAVTHQSSGLIVDTGAPEKLAQALESLLQDPEQCLKYGAAARQRVEDHFTIGHYVQHVESLYADIL